MLLARTCHGEEPHSCNAEASPRGRSPARISENCVSVAVHVDRSPWREPRPSASSTWPSEQSVLAPLYLAPPEAARPSSSTPAGELRVRGRIDWRVHFSGRRVAFRPITAEQLSDDVAAY
jgi:hypothetical protein